MGQGSWEDASSLTPAGIPTDKAPSWLHLIHADLQWALADWTGFGGDWQPIIRAGLTPSNLKALRARAFAPQAP